MVRHVRHVRHASWSIGDVPRHTQNWPETQASTRRDPPKQNASNPDVGRSGGLLPPQAVSNMIDVG